ncbi:hypothetical protein B0T24DRAFT_683682 [Lasiosphaeria ovina]|uniref:Uncharacterized protein n=1 Tax=Lasiosphaeria ovina TaxID=92902 RepID=A0AAE0JVC9_9PEZI|nr:hypothetical protein B0T24DRAFT_683682 [Lasiosphaeria ovina]
MRQVGADEDRGCQGTECGSGETEALRELKDIWDTLTTTAEFDADSQTLDEVSKLYVGKYPSLLSWYQGHYENMVTAMCCTDEVFVKLQESRDRLRVIELARRSYEGRTAAWS